MVDPVCIDTCITCMSAPGHVDKTRVTCHSNNTVNCKFRVVVRGGVNPFEAHAVKTFLLPSSEIAPPPECPGFGQGK